MKTMPKYGDKTDTNQKQKRDSGTLWSKKLQRWLKIFAWILWNFLTRFVDTVSGKECLKTFFYVRVGVRVGLRLISN